MAKAHRGHKIDAPLPTDRVTHQKPFGVTGIDFAGPLYIKVGSNMRKRLYCTLYMFYYTCVHLELYTDMTTDKFCWLSNGLLGDEDCHTPSKRTTPRPFRKPTNTWLNYGPVYLQRKLT